MMPFATCFCYQRCRVEDWRAVQGNVRLVFTESEEAVRRGAISFDKQDKNAIYVRMLGDVRLRTSSEERATLTPAEATLLDKLSSDDHEHRWSSRFQSFHKHRRKRRPTQKSTLQLQSLLDQHYLKQAEELMTKLNIWDFDIFNLDVLTGGQSLRQVALHLFQSYGLISTFKLDILKLLQTFALIENGYHGSNPYHNSVHAADVTQAMHCYLQEDELRDAVPQFEVMTSLLAAMTHDLDHPGVNQAFLIATANHLADLYQNTSVLENHHWRFAVGVLHETGVFNHLEPHQWEQVIWHLRALILATDITRQQEFLSRFKKYLDDDSLNYRTDSQDRIFMLQIALKCADICNPCREWRLSHQWSERVCDEFFRQGDYERKIQIPVTPLCNRETMTMAKIQAGFMEYVVDPLFQAWNRFLPSELSSVMLNNVAQNRKKWQQIIEKEEEVKVSDEDTNNEEEKSDVVEETRLPLNYIHRNEDDNMSSYTDSRRGSCRSLSPVREVIENGWDPEQRRHSMPPAYIRREITCVTIRRDSVPMSQYLRRRSLPTAMIVQTSSLEKLTGKFSSLANHKQSLESKSVSMEELLTRPKLSNLTASYETSRLASGLSVVADQLYPKSHSNTVRFLSLPQHTHISDGVRTSPSADANTFRPPSNYSPHCDQKVTSKPESIALPNTH